MLRRATKLGKRAATVGFDWPDTAGVRAKVGEELAELDAATASGNASEIAAEMGDLLLSIANWCRHLDWANFDRHCRLDADARPTLDELRRRGMKLGIITNGSSEMQRHKWRFVPYWPPIVPNVPKIRHLSEVLALAT